jgi:hypothetical protein
VKRDEINDDDGLDDGDGRWRVNQQQQQKRNRAKTRRLPVSIPFACKLESGELCPTMVSVGWRDREGCLPGKEREKFSAASSREFLD